MERDELIPQAAETLGASGQDEACLELERAREQLSYERGLFEAVIRTVSEAVLATDATRRITMVNDAARELLGLSRRCVGRVFDDVIAHGSVGELLDRALRGEAGSLELELELEGGVRSLLASASANRGQGGAVLILHDVTELRRLEIVRRNFVNSVSQELRTPVSVIQANTETLLSGALEDPAQARRFLHAVRRNAERLTRLIAELSAPSADGGSPKT